MTTAVEICREEFTQAQLKKLTDKASWQALFPVALEMGFDIRRMATLNYDYIELRDLMGQTWRENVARLTQCRNAYKKVRKETEKQRQLLMDFHLKEKNQ